MASEPQVLLEIPPSLQDQLPEIAQWWPFSIEISWRSRLSKGLLDKHCQLVMEEIVFCIHNQALFPIVQNKDAKQRWRWPLIWEDCKWARHSIGKPLICMRRTWIRNCAVDCLYQCIIACQCTSIRPSYELMLSSRENGPAMSCWVCRVGWEFWLFFFGIW